MTTSMSEGIVSRRLLRLAMVAALPLLALACSNDSPPAGGGTGGSNGTGGSAAGTGGTSGGTGGTSAGTGGSSAGTGGTAAGTGGASGTGGTDAGTDAGSGTGGTTAIDGGVAPCGAATATAPLISDFAGTTPVSNQANGGTDLWSISPAGMATIMVAGGEMHAQSTSGSYASTSTVVGGLTAKCVDVTKYSGVKFKIRSPTNTSLLFVVVTPETSPDSSNFRKQITVTPTATTVMVAFADLVKAPFGVGMTLPASYLPAAHMAAIAFGVGTMTELLNIYLDDVTFY